MLCELFIELFITLFLLRSTVTAQAVTLEKPSQPQQKGVIGGFDIIGKTLVSAQQLFLGTEDKVFIVDKVQNNPTKHNGYPAWASGFSLADGHGRTMNALTNTFCAGGAVMGNGTWVNVGGNQAVTWGGEAAPDQSGGGPYNNADGRQSMRLFNPCDDHTCDWVAAPDMTTRRWYPTVETLADGTLIILGGCQWGGYVNDALQDNPTFEFFPSKGAPITSNILQSTLPANLYPLTWLLPSGKLFVQSNWDTALIDLRTYKETPLNKMIDAVRTYPASAGTIILPLTPANNYTATILFCGGSNKQSDQWKPLEWEIIKYKASTSCVTISPDQDAAYTPDDPLPVARTMASLIHLPTGQILCLNGGETGTAGYGNETWAAGHSYADDPVTTPVLFDPSSPRGQRWSSKGFSASTIPRMYHSSATLLPDGSVFVSGSNPNPDYIPAAPSVKYPTEYRTEKFYPAYYNERRPEPVGLLSQLGYGGEFFDVKLTSKDLFDEVENIKTASVVIIRTGFSTHAMNMGQRFIQLRSTYTGHINGSATLHVDQLPPNPSIFPPGPALIFVVVKGVPSVGRLIMIGTGELGEQPTLAASALPESKLLTTSAKTTGDSQDNRSTTTYTHSRILLFLSFVVCFFGPVLGL